MFSCPFFTIEVPANSSQPPNRSVYFKYKYSLKKFFLFSDISMSYRPSVVKVPDYSSSSFSTEGFSVYKNVQTGY